MPRKHVIHQQPVVLLCSLAVGAVLFGVGCLQARSYLARQQMPRPVPPPASSVPTKQQVKAVETAPTSKLKDVLPKSFNLDVPFVKQAPLGVWDALHEETCEEASVLTVHAYYEGKRYSDQDVERELLALVETQKKLFGFFEDTTVAQTVTFAKARYGFSRAVTIEKPTLEQIKREIYAGRPVLFPADGKALKNPNFRGGGPKYHLIVLRGWNEQGFFTNDPGTRKGENFYYPNAIISEANHDWNEVDHAATGPARVFVLYQ